MAEHPMLFSVPLVREVRAGVKTQTRRIIKGDPLVAKCPAGEPGDLIWIRETFASGTMTGGRPWVRYAADDPKDLPAGTRWKPSIHMPRSLCRTRLRVTAVWQERLQSITETAARAEGVKPRGDGSAAYRVGFQFLWSELYGRESWDADPWVWAVQFYVSTEKP